MSSNYALGVHSSTGAVLMYPCACQITVSTNPIIVKDDLVYYNYHVAVTAVCDEHMEIMGPNPTVITTKLPE